MSESTFKKLEAQIREDCDGSQARPFSEWADRQFLQARVMLAHIDALQAQLDALGASGVVASPEEWATLVNLLEHPPTPPSWLLESLTAARCAARRVVHDAEEPTKTYAPETPHDVACASYDQLEEYLRVSGYNRNTIRSLDRFQLEDLARTTISQKMGRGET